MNIAIIGASGFVGSSLLKEALNRGHHVTAIVRHPEKITIQNPNLKIKKGNILNQDEVSRLTEGLDAVISAYNPGWSEPEIYNFTIRGYQSIINGVKKAGVKRLLVVGGGGSLETSPGHQLVDSDEFPKEWKAGALALRDVLNMLKKENDLNWTFFSPAIVIEPGKRTGKFRLGKDQPIINEKGEGKISVEDYAVAMIDELENPKHIKERFTIGY